ncbi:MAG: Kazal-type serine protease inhibitor domain-containing protein, partial [Planctomycetota bacterium]
GACAPRPEVCAEIFQPVCGCDGETYGNACVAASAGVNVDAEGACPEPACRADDDCARGEYCSRPDGECGGAGVCAEQPLECRDVDEPVCGCDGEDYANACDAAAAGVSVAGRGRCRPDEGACRTAADCPADALCARPEGACGAPGECMARPDLCPQDAMPVCACDGQSYGNRCMAAVAGVSVAYAGRCDPPDGACADNADCAEDELCARAACAGEGVCQPRPDGCAAVYDPVCGCDGRTWGNACSAAAAGVGVAHGGECEAQACEHNGDCGNARFCARAAGVCDGAGFCEPRPQVCPDVWLPVCGCDGETYGNECEAAAAGRTVRARGECEVDEARCDRHADCGDGRYCARPEGRCEGPGICQDRPQLCEGVRDPVCGCDGETRPNDCLAARDGANVRHRGRCDFDGCAHDADCGLGEICRFEEGLCGGAGACEPRPADCPAVVDLVCACDGVTYGSACDALAEGQSVAHAGPCPAPGCATNADCGRGEYCERPAGACDVPGECQPWPVVRCANVDEPVCGCDGEDYMNACLAAGAGMTVDHIGRCGADQIACEADGDCGRRGYCARAPGACGGPGMCAPPPPPGECGDLMRPVCGCDGETYLNACRARVAGVSIDAEGACP